MEAEGGRREEVMGEGGKEEGSREGGVVERWREKGGEGGRKEVLGMRIHICDLVLLFGLWLVCM